MACQDLPMYTYIKMKKNLTILLLTTLLFTSCSKDSDLTTASETEGKATVTFDATFNGSDFALNTTLTSGAKTFNFSKLRYWVSNVILINTAGAEIKIPGSYYLLEETNKILIGDLQDVPNEYPASKREDINLLDIPAGDYKAIKFAVGVDQKYNDNLSISAGELAQYNGMTGISWMWLTSYIFTSTNATVKEGTVTKNLSVETGLNANYKAVSLSFPTILHISSLKSTKIILNVDVSKAFDGIDVMATPTVGASQPTLMSTVTNNYATKVFSVKSVN